MKGKIGYIIFILVLLGILYFLNTQAPRHYVWEATFSRHDKQPFGAYAFDRILKESMEEGYTHSYKSITQLLADRELTGQNLLIITESFSSYDGEIKKLLDYVGKGRQVFISAEYFETELMDILQFSSEYDYQLTDYISKDIRNHVRELSFCDETTGKKSYRFPSVNVGSYFSDLKDSIRAIVVAEDWKKRPVMLRYAIGKGNLILACNPKIFTNYGILDNESNGFIRNALGYVDNASLIRTEHYHAGTDENQSSFRFLQENTPLRWAYYLTLITILLFMIFTAKRKQKAIPVIRAPENKMLDFIKSISALYLRRNNNADIVRKKHLYWAGNLKQEYGLDIINDAHDSGFYSRFSHKTGVPVDQAKTLFSKLDAISGKTRLSDEDMMNLVIQMNSIK